MEENGESPYRTYQAIQTWWSKTPTPQKQGGPLFLRAIVSSRCVGAKFFGTLLCFAREVSLVRESIANPCMDFKKSTDINMDIHDFWMSVFNYPYKRGYPH